MNFQESVDYLLSLGNEVSAMKLGLENIRKVLAALGDPQYKYLKVQVAGTNGKGSVCAFLNSICIASGKKVGMYTSPHLISITERIQIDGHEISRESFAVFGTRVREISEQLVDLADLESVPTFFEQMTVIALLAFAEARVDLAILETGLGGRFDAVTAADADVLAITRIDLDHQKYLGETIEEIAGEKAAIIKSEFDNVVIGAQQPAALNVILDRCRELGTNVQQYSRWTVAADGPETVRVETTESVSPNVKLGVAGRHQIENAETAINVVQSLFYDYGISIKDDDIIAGLKNAHHAGRLEWIGRYLLDGAHNVGGAKALREYLDEFVDRPITMVFGSMNDKASDEILKILTPTAERLILTRAANSRSRPSGELLGELPTGFDREHATLADDVSEALEKAREISDARNVILITGSLYLVGEAKQLLTGETETEM